MGILYIVSTPIGNLEDISKRALRILSEVDLILCEDTRVTKKLLDFYQIKTRTISYHQHSELKKTEEIVGFLKAGGKIALVSDAGTPGISDPGNKLIEEIVTKENIANVLSIPGPSALTAAVSISGFPMDRFLFLGFPPAKKKRTKFFSQAAGSDYPVIFYESPYRIKKTLADLAKVKSEAEIVVCRELTKKFETTYRGSVQEVLEELEKREVKGEFVVIVNR